MKLTSEDVLFLGKGSQAVSWYRTAMPSMYLGTDWMGILGEPPDLKSQATLKRRPDVWSNPEDYKVVVIQQVKGEAWTKKILELRARGIKVIYENDDYLRGLAEIESHQNREWFQKYAKDYEMCMAACDAMIVSTDWLAERYGEFNKNVYVCRNGIESKRYAQFKLPERTSYNVGWAGGMGHKETASTWIPAIVNLLDEYEDMRFISLGLPLADLIPDRPSQSVSLPWASIENFPAALTNFDVALAPAGKTDFFAAKSDLRWLETGALGIPLIADPFVYKDIEHGKTGMLASTPAEAEDCIRQIVEDPGLYQKISRNVQKKIQDERTIEVMIQQWENVFRAVGDL